MYTDGKWYVDPVKGHEYGFPLVYDGEKDGDFEEWIFAQGYPSHLYYAYTDFIRIWRCEE